MLSALRAFTQTVDPDDAAQQQNEAADGPDPEGNAVREKDCSGDERKEDDWIVLHSNGFCCDVINTPHSKPVVSQKPSPAQRLTGILQPARLSLPA